MMWYVDAEAIEEIAVGAGVLGTGGGGSPYIGKLMVLRHLAAGATIPVVGPEEVADGATCVSLGGMGAPIVSVEKIWRGDEPLVAMRALERYSGRKVQYIVPQEIGGSNSLRPLAMAAQAGLPVVDGDAMGRAFPELQMNTFSIYGLECTPAAIADVRHDVALFPKLSSTALLERYARVVTVQMGGSVGFAFPLMSGADLKRTAIPRTLTLARAIGRAVRRARARHEDPIAALLAVTGGEVLFRGKVIDVERRMTGGFARGHSVVAGLDSDHGETRRIDFQNENLIVRSGDAAVAVVPDLITLVDLATAEPVTTEVVRYGLRVAVLGIPAPALLRTTQALAVVGPRAFGYNLDYTPLAGRYGGDRLAPESGHQQEFVSNADRG
jgi:DUF917 family protein